MVSSDVDWDAVAEGLEATQARWTEELVEFCVIPSEPDQPAAIDQAADWVDDRLRAAGATVHRLRHNGSSPLVVGEIGPASGPVVLAVQHYDVQPAGDPDLWASPPYEPAVRDGRLYARGAVDNKGELLLRVWALEAYRRVMGGLPWRVRFLVEGEEEAGSPNLASLLAQEPALTEADAAVGEGGGVDEQGRPMVIAGNKGIVVVRLDVRTLTTDVHSGAASLLPNAAARLAAALATIVKSDGAPAWPGYDADVAPLNAAAKAAVREMPLSLLDEMRTQFGVTRFVNGLDGYDALEAEFHDPTCNIQAMWSGDGGASGRNIVPGEASARLDLRLVPDQDPQRVVEGLRAHLESHGFGDVTVEPVGPAARAYWTDLDHPIVDLAADACDSAFGKPSIRIPSIGGTAPMYQICGARLTPMVYMGGGDIHGQAHAPNESISIDTARTAALAFLRFLAGAEAVSTA